MRGAHFILILYMCALSSSSHLAALITLRKYLYKHKIIARLRLTLVITFAITLLIVASITAAKPTAARRMHAEVGTAEAQPQNLNFLAPIIFTFIGFSLVLACILHYDHPKTADVRQKRYILINPLVAFLVQILLAVLGIVFVATQKASKSPPGGKWCGLQDFEENKWGFGQVLSMLMLLLPFMNAAHTYLEGRHQIQKEY